MNKIKDRWSALSMQQRADLIKLYTNNGITNINDIRKHYNSFDDGIRILDGTEGEQTLSGKKPTLEEFIQAKTDSTRNAAFEKSNVRKRGIEIVYPLEDKRRLQNMECIGEHYVAHPDFVGPVRQKDYLINNPEFVKLHEQEFKELDNNCQYGYNCIGTATSEYPEDSRTTVNTDFQTNYQKYGFKIIPEEEALDGDIVQNINDEGAADHGMIYAGKDSDGNNLFNYSNGRITERSYRIHRPFPHPNQLFYRYVGTPELIQQWTEEYNTNRSKKYGGKLNKFAIGGPTEKDTIPMYSDEDGNLYDVLPGVVDIRGLNRREVKKLAQEIAGRDTHEWDVTNRELASGLATVQGKNRDQEARFNRIFEKQYKKNLDYSRQIERAKRAGKGDTSALVDYMNYGQNEAASYLAPLLGIPAASVLASSEVLMPVAKQVFKTMMNPANARTTAGALAATGLDASGVAFGAAGMGNIVENWMRGDFAPSDIPAFALNAMDAIPGAAAVNATIGAAQDAKRVRQATRYINDAVEDINASRAREIRIPAYESNILPEPPREIIIDLNDLTSNPEVTQLASDLDLDINTFLRRAPEDMVNVEPSHTIEETSTLRNTRREPEPFDWDAFEDANVTPLDIPRIGTRNYIERTLRDRGVSQSDIDGALNEYDNFVRLGGQDSEFWDTSIAETIAALSPEGTPSSGIRRITPHTPESDPSIAYGNRRITRSEVERLLRENGATQGELDLVLGDFDTASSIGDGESFWWTSSGQRMNSLIPRQDTDFIDLSSDNRLYREDLERTLRSAGYEQDVISEALFDFDHADLGWDPFIFINSRSGRLYDRLQRGIGRNEIELSDGNIVDADRASRIMRNLGYNEDAINRLINNSVREGYPLHTSNPSPGDLTDAGLRIHIDSLDEDTAIHSYASLLGMKKKLGTESGRYKERTRTLNQGDERSFKVFAERMSKIFDDNIDFTDLSEDNYVKIKNYLRSKGILSGDIEHMNWFQMGRSLPKDANGDILVTEADGTTRPLMFGERPQYSTKGQIQAGRLAMQMYDDIPRGYAVAEVNTSVDSEKLKLRGATSRYGFEPNQFSVEIVDAPFRERGNNYQHERLYLRDILKYRDQLSESEQVMLDKLLNKGYINGEVTWEDLQGTKLLDFIKNEYSDLTNRLVETLSVPWRRIKNLDSRSEIQNAPMPSYTGSIDYDIKILLEEGNYSPHIKRQPIHVVKHEDGGPLKSNFNLTFDYRDQLPSDYPSNYVELADYQLPHSLERNTFDAYTAPYIQGWNAEDIDYLYSRLGDTGFAPEAVMYALGTESSYNPYAKSKISSAIGLGQLTKGTLKSLYPKDWEDIYDQYINEERSIRDVIDDAISNLARINKNITSERDNLGYGRLKVNLLAPNASLDSRISGVILKSLTKEQKKKVTNNFTYRDLMNMYQEEFDKKFK